MCAPVDGPLTRPRLGGPAQPAPLGAPVTLTADQLWPPFGPSWPRAGAPGPRRSLSTGWPRNMTCTSLPPHSPSVCGLPTAPTSAPCLLWRSARTPYSAEPRSPARSTPPEPPRTCTPTLKDCAKLSQSLFASWRDRMVQFQFAWDGSHFGGAPQHNRAREGGTLSEPVRRS